MSRVPFVFTQSCLGGRLSSISPKIVCLSVSESLDETTCSAVVSKATKSATDDAISVSLMLSIVSAVLQYAVRKEVSIPQLDFFYLAALQPQQ